MKLIISLLLAGAAFHISYAGIPRWQQVGTVKSAVYANSSVILNDGSVLIVGGIDATGTAVDHCQLLNVATDAIQDMPRLSTPRGYFGLIVVNRANGSDVYAIGGYTGTGNSFAATASVERFVYNSTTKTGVWQSSGTLTIGIADTRAALLGTTIVVAGGIEQATGAPGTGTKSKRAWSINTATGAVTALGDLVSAHAQHIVLRYQTQTGPMAVLAAGGENGAPATSTELLVNNTWDARANPPRQWRADGVGITDVSSIARVFGGDDASSVPSSVCEWYDVKSGWRVAPKMTIARSKHSGIPVASNTDTADAVLIVNGRSTPNTTASCELFTLPSGSDPTGQWSEVPNSIVSAHSRSLAMSAWNLPVASGGAQGNSRYNIVEMLQPLRASDISMPDTEVGSLGDSVPLNIINTWVLPVTARKLTVLDGADFFITHDTSAKRIPAQGSKRVLVWFRPAVEGKRTAKIEIDMGPVKDTVLISGVGLQSTVALTTSAIDFKDVLVRQQKDTCLTLVVNKGTDTLRVDSLVSASDEVQIVSPIGRSKVAPGDTLTVCLRYKPATRSTLAGVIDVYVGAKRLPVATIGKGIRRYAAFLPQQTCDTLSVKINEPSPIVAILTNPADLPVVVTNLTISSTTPGAVVVDPTFTFPVTIQPNAQVAVPLIFTPAREAREDIQLRTTDNGDTIASTSMCVVPRSRFPGISVSDIPLGVVCAGDIVKTSLHISNASQVESIVIQSADLQNIDGAIRTATPVTIPPRGDMDIEIEVEVPTTLLPTSSLFLTGPWGSMNISFTATINTSISYSIADAIAAAGDELGIRLTATRVDAPVSTFRLAYNPKLLNPQLQLRKPIPSVQSATITIIEPGIAEVTINYTTLPGPGDIIAAVPFDVLRGDGSMTDVRIIPTPSNPCVVRDTADIQVIPSCGGSGGYVFGDTAPAVLTNPSPAGSTALLTLINYPDRQITLRVSDASGIVQSEVNIEAGMKSYTIDLTHLPSGVYSLTAVTGEFFARTMLIHQQ